MVVSYDLFIEYFLDKVKEYDFLDMDDYDRTKLVEGFMKRACAQFNKICKYDIVSCDEENRVFLEEIPEEDIDEIADIVSEGMIVQWLKPLMYKQENYENLLNTTDYSGYSPANLLERTTEAYNMCKKDYTNKMREYSFSHGDLTELHL